MDETDDGAHEHAARFVFVSDLPPRAPAGATAGTHRVGWRLIAANNRPLGRSVPVWPSFEAALAAARLLHARSAALDPLVQHDASAGRWTWTVRLDGAPVAVTAHGYLRRIQCMRALDQFLTAVRDHEPHADGARRWGERALPGQSTPAVPTRSTP